MTIQFEGMYEVARCYCTECRESFYIVVGGDIEKAKCPTCGDKI